MFPLWILSLVTYSYAHIRLNQSLAIFIQLFPSSLKMPGVATRSVPSDFGVSERRKRVRTDEHPNPYLNPTAKDLKVGCFPTRRDDRRVDCLAGAEATIVSKFVSVSPAERAWLIAAWPELLGGFQNATCAEAYWRLLPILRSGTELAQGLLDWATSRAIAAGRTPAPDRSRSSCWGCMVNLSNVPKPRASRKAC